MQICTFTIEKYHAGMVIDAIQEIIVDMPIRMVPLAGREVCGLMNLRGQIIMILDLSALMGLPEKQKPGRMSHIIIGQADNTASLLVDSIGDIIEIDSALCMPLPMTMSENFQKVFESIYATDDGNNILILNRKLAESPDLIDSLCI